MSSPRRIFTALAAALLVLAPAGVAIAAEPADVVAEIRDDGVFVEDGAAATEERIGIVVAEGRFDGENLSVVVLAEEPVGGATAFAGAVFDRLGGGLVLVVAPESIGYDGVPDVWTKEELDAGLDLAFLVIGSDADVAMAFVEAIVEPSSGPGVPAMTTEPQGAPATTSGLEGAPATSPSQRESGGVAWIWILVIVGVGALVVAWLVRRSHRASEESAARRLAAARAEIQKQVDAVANDLLALEDEVRAADDPRADGFYEQAAETYRTATSALETAATADQLLAISNDLDDAIWRLDSAEAVLDGHPLPDRPVRKTLEPEPATTRPPRPEYQRRPSRQSAMAGPGMMDLLTMIGGAVLSGGLGGGRRSRGGLFGGIGRGGGGRVPRRAASPSRRSAPTRTRQRPPARRGTDGKRVRGGRRRRR